MGGILLIIIFFRSKIKRQKKLLDDPLKRKVVQNSKYDPLPRSTFLLLLLMLFQNIIITLFVWGFYTWGKGKNPGSLLTYPSIFFSPISIPFMTKRINDCFFFFYLFF